MLPTANASVTDLYKNDIRLFMPSKGSKYALFPTWWIISSGMKPQHYLSLYLQNSGSLIVIGIISSYAISSSSNINILAPAVKVIDNDGNDVGIHCSSQNGPQASVTVSRSLEKVLGLLLKIHWTNDTPVLALNQYLVNTAFFCFCLSKSPWGF